MADYVIDTLSIQINASSQGTSKAINSLIGNLDRLSGALDAFEGASAQHANAFDGLITGLEKLNATISSLDTEKLNSLAKSMSTLSASASKLNGAFGNNPFGSLASGLKQLDGITMPDLTSLGVVAGNVGKLANKKASAGIQMLPQLVQGLQSLNQLQGIVIPDLTGLAEFTKTIGSLGSKKAVSAATNFQPLINGLKELSKLNGMSFPDAQNLASLANSFSVLGRETSGRAIQNIPQLAKAFEDLMKTLSNAPQVSDSVIRLAEAMAKLSQSGANFNVASNNISNAFTRIFSNTKSLIGRVLNFGKSLVTSGKNAEYAGSRYNTLVSI